MSICFSGQRYDCVVDGARNNRAGLGVEDKSSSDADIVIVDPGKEFEIKGENLHSKQKVTAFNGYKVKGTPLSTIVRGEVVMEKGEVIVLVDTDTSKENVSRAAESQGWQVIEVKPEETGYSIKIKKE